MSSVRLGGNLSLRVWGDSFRHAERSSPDEGWLGVA